jgi:hypothetical protein
LPVGDKDSHDYIPFAEEDGVTPLTFESVEEARATATSPKHAPVLASIDYPWRIAAVAEPLPSRPLFHAKKKGPPRKVAPNGLPTRPESVDYRSTFTPA